MQNDLILSKSRIREKYYEHIGGELPNIVAHGIAKILISIAAATLEYSLHAQII